MLLRRAVLGFAPCLLLTGCCSLARLFCGPDDSRWVSVTYDTPRDTVATLLEAIRRDASDVIYECLASGFRRELGGGSVEFQIIWEEIKRRAPGIHLAGYAEIPAPTRLADNGATFVLDVEGNRLEVDLVRLSFRSIVYERPDDAPAGESKLPIGSWNDRASIETVPDDEFDRSRLVFRPFEFPHEGLARVPLSSIRRAGLIREWKISGLRSVE